MSEAADLFSVTQGREAADAERFIEVQLPISKLSKECYKERKAGAGQTLTGLGGYWKGRKPLILVRAVVLGLLLPASTDPDQDRAIFLKLMLMDDSGLLKRRKPFDGGMAARVAELLSEDSWSQAISCINNRFTWTRGIPRDVREAIEVEAFLAMGLDEKLRNCLRPEELPDTALDDVWDEINAHLGTHARSLPTLVDQLGSRRFEHRPRVGDPFCGGGSIPFEAARSGCDVYASDLNPVACLLTWGALNVVGGTEASRHTDLEVQTTIVRGVEEEIVRLGIEHDGDECDLRLRADAPTRWPHNWRVTRRGEPIAPTDPQLIVTCPQSGWRVPMLDSCQVNLRHKVVLTLVADPVAREYQIVPRVGVDIDTWEAAAVGTVVRENGALFLVHQPGSHANAAPVRARIANRAKAFLYCVEVTDPNTGWKVPLAPSWVISRNYRTVACLIPNPPEKRFDIDVVMQADDVALKAAANGTIDGNYLRMTLDGQEHRASIERLRGEVRLKSRYRKPAEAAMDRARFEACRNHYADMAANDLRRWELDDVVPRPDDVFQERLYAIQWLTPDGSLFFTAARAEDIAREKQVEAIVRENLSSWQTRGLVPDSSIEPGDKTGELIRTRGWTYWHHLFTPRHLFIGALVRAEMTRHGCQEAAALAFCSLLDRSSRLSQWRIGHSGKQDVAPSSDYPEHVSYNMALNTFMNFAARSFYSNIDSLSLVTKNYQLVPRSVVQVAHASDLEQICDYFITDPPYADAIHYHEITEYFIAWLSKNPPRRDWVWDSRRELAIRGESRAFRRSMVEAYTAMAAHMPDNGFQMVMFTHQSVSVWADLAEILWAAGLHVTAGWCVATETEQPTRAGSYVQGTVLLVLRKRLGEVAGFIARLQRPVEVAVMAKLQTMRELDDGEEPNFGDADYQLAAYAAALEVLTRYAAIDGRPVTAEVLRERRPGDVSEVERLLHRAVRIASDFLVPAGLVRAVWDELGPEERFYLKGLDLERAGENRISAYQELARGFGVEHRALLSSTEPNKVRLKTAHEFGLRDLKRAGSADKAEDRALEGFAGGLVRHVLYAIHVAREMQELRPALDWFTANLPEYWTRQRRVIELLDYFAKIRTAARADEATTARDLRGAVDNHRL